VVGLESNGLHSNGFSLVRKVFSQNELKRMSAELLKPTRIYVKPVLSLLSTMDYGLWTIEGISHITGGAFYDKIARILPGNIDVRINKNSWAVPEIFRLIQNKGNLDDREMYHTLNMGIGMVLIVERGAAAQVISKLAAFKLAARVIGEVVRGTKKVEVI
jgi:phosphoribosylformylglycinamidine cyclo-ligase